MLTKFYIAVSSATEFAAIKAALATKGISIKHAVEEGVSLHFPNSMGNFAYGDKNAQKSIDFYNYYDPKGNKEGRFINGIAELIPFLESGEYKVKETEYTVTRTTIVTDFIKVKAINAIEAEKLARQADDPEYFQTSRGTEYTVQ